MIRDALKVFADGSTQIGKATQELLGELNLNFQYEQTDEAMDFATMYCGVTGQQVPQNLGVVLDSVEATYLVGFMTHKSLQELNEEHNDSTQLVGDFLCFAVDVKPGITLSRSKAATLVRGFNRIASANPVLLIIRQEGVISLALCERTEYTQQWRQGKKLGKVRILMGINCMNPHRGHVDMLERLAKHSYTDHKQVYEHWLEVFSVSNLTDLFYTELQNWYFWAVRVAEFPNDVSRTDDYQTYNDEALIRLITRLIFVWFLKEKGLINADLFDEEKLMGILKDFNPQAADNGAYYNAILQNLFFATLNQEIGNRGFVKSYPASKDQHNIKTYYRGKELFNAANEDDIKALFASTPYVNGSLFECLDDRKADGVTYHYDGFSNKTAFKNGTMRRALIPNRLFFAPEGSERLDMKEEYGKDGTYMVTVSGLINILNRYHFTIEENTPSEEQIALDPELLGRTFENLLGAFNPETKQSARKATGSYYTPREIVDYMVEQSLKAYFTTKCPNVAEDDIASLLDDSETMKPENISDEHTEALMQAIYSCNILDPACGSGAFPMGILQRLVIALRKLDADNSHWGNIIKGEAMKEIDEALEKDEEERKIRLTAIEESFTRQKEHPDFARKLYVIESCIHGVDIQPIAIQISKLRFFISLLCDQKTDSDPADNYGILTLPNLETNLVAANSLIAPEKKQQGNIFEDPKIEETKAELTEVRHRLFSARKVKDKIKLRKRDEELRTTLVNLLQENGSFAPEDAKQLAAWNPYDQNASSPFFDPEWMFGIKGGFDIVIGNPPYVQLQSNDGEFGDLYEACGYKTFARMGDMYCLFYERGWQLLKHGGHLCYITSNKWMRAGYGEKTRGFFANYTNPILLIDFAGVKIFENATVDTNIMLFSRSENRHETTCFIATKGNKDSVKKNLNSFVQQQHTIYGFNSSDSWVILSPIEQSIKQKIEAVGTPLKDWDIQIYRGVLTGCNEAFIISTEKRNEILANCLTEEERKRTEELIRPILRGKDIKRYGYDWAGKWLIATFPSRHYDIEQYPAVKNYLLSFGKQRLEQTGTTYIVNGEKVKSRKKTNNKWFETQDSINYWEDFDKPKVIYMEIQTDNPNEGYLFPCFSYDDTNAVVLNTAYIMCSHTVDVRYILGILNSKLGKFLVKMYVTQLQERQFRMLAQYTNRFPIPKISAEQMGKITELVELEINSHNDDIETDIDNIVFNIFGLNENEIKHVKDREV